MLASKHHDTSSQRKAWFTRAVLCIVLLFVSLQLLGVAYHAHAYSDTTTHCATCDFDQYLPPALPPSTVFAVPVAEAVSYPIAAAKAYISFFQPSYLIPLAQAPPA